MSTAARPPNRAAWALLPRSMTADRTRRGDLVRRLHSRFREALCEIAALSRRFSPTSIRQACYRAPLVTGGRTSLRVPRRQAGVSALLLGLLVAGVLGTFVPGAHADRIGAKRAQAQAVLVQLQRLDAAAQRANSRYQAASRKLRRVERQLRINHQALGVARGNLGHARRTLARRLAEIYTTQDQQSSLAVVLGARSLDDLLSRIETANSMSNQDAALIQQVVGFQ
ncbi:MAG: coiled-coil domain-containing protein, partial [Gaiellaceae bacterium]